MPKSPLLLAVLVALAIATPASASIALLDELIITKNNSIIFDDEFSDGMAPPSAPHFSNGDPTLYGVNGSFPAGSEAGGFLTLDTARGVPVAAASGIPRISIGAVLGSPNSGPNALTSADEFDIEADFSLLTPVGPLFNGYGIDVGNFGSSSPVRFVQLYVVYDPVTGLPYIAYVLQDYSTHTATLLDVAAFTPPPGATEIALGVTRPDATNDNFFASWVYFDGPTNLESGSFSTPAALFQSDDFVRAHVSAVSDVPEPASLALVGMALAGLAAARRRRPK